METTSERLPPSLKVLADMLRSTSRDDPASERLLEELDLVASRLPSPSWGDFVGYSPPTPQVLAQGLAGSFAAGGYLKIGMGGGSGSEGTDLEDCPLGCGRRRTKLAGR